MRRMLSPHTRTSRSIARVSAPALKGNVYDRDEVEFLLVDGILRLGTSKSHRLANDLQQFQAQPGLHAELTIGRPDEPAIPVPAGKIQESQGEIAVSHGGADPLERKPSFLEAPNQPHSPNIADGEQRAGLWLVKDAEFDQPIHVSDVDRRSLGHGFARESPHGHG